MSDSAMTWKLQNETISKVDDLRALPVGSVIAEVGEPTAPAIACKTARGQWQFLGNDSTMRASEDIYTDGHPTLRLVVLYNPVQEVGRLLYEREEIV
jgi:hypothetical protein